jgi:hypothetical protein
MDMATRVRRAWQALHTCVGSAEPGSTAFLEGVREWLRTRVPQVSKNIRTSLPSAVASLEGAPVAR